MAGYDYLFGPLVGLLTVGVLALILRWIFGTGAAGPPLPRDPQDYGLLTPVATVADRAAAEQIRSRLAEHGVRSTAAPGAGALVVLVFAGDEARARQVLAERR